MKKRKERRLKYAKKCTKVILRDGWLFCLNHHLKFPLLQETRSCRWLFCVFAAGSPSSSSSLRSPTVNREDASSDGDDPNAKWMRFILLPGAKKGTESLQTEVIIIMIGMGERERRETDPNLSCVSTRGMRIKSSQKTIPNSQIL